MEEKTKAGVRAVRATARESSTPTITIRYEDDVVRSVARGLDTASDHEIEALLAELDDLRRRLARGWRSPRVVH